MPVPFVIAAGRGHSMRMSARRLRAAAGALACFLGLALAAGGAGASTGTGDATRPAAAGKQKEPALLIADDLSSDEQLGLVIARGNVELFQVGRTVRADTVAYNQKSKIVIASGHVRMFEPGGDVTFTEYAELTDDLHDAFIDKARIILSDNSRAVGTEGERVGGRYTRLNHATYSPCALCAGHPEVPPVWQIRARKMSQDNVDKDIRYTDATMELLGVPVFYTPYFSHPDPSVKRRSGLLTPMVGGNHRLGSFYRQSYYFDIQPDLDATFDATVYTKTAPMVGGDVRKRFESGMAQVSGSIVYADKDTRLRPSQGQSWRGFARANSLFDINDAWRAGSDISYASDRTFLNQFYGFHGNLLTSKAFTEGFWGQDYATIRSYRFQDLRQGNRQVAPTVPLAQYALTGEPGETFGGRWSLDSGVVGVTRMYGPDSARISLQPGWSRELVSGTGLVTTLNTRARADVWNFAGYNHVDFRSGDPVTGQHAGSVSRVFPQAQVKFAYPFVRNGESAQQVVEPQVALTAAPHLSNKRNFPNEDSRDVELDDTSLFRFNRYVGQDRQEGGQRVTYGVRTGFYGFNEGSGGIFVGQDRRLSSDRPFAAGTGLDQRGSDLVGHIDVTPVSWLYADYRVNTKGETAKPRRETATTSVGGPLLTFSTSYHYDQSAADPTNLDITQRQEFMSFGASSKFSRYWSVSAGHSQAFSPNPGARTTTGLLTYADECLTFQTFINVDYTSQTDLGPSKTFYVRLAFKNFGDIASPSINPVGLFGGRSKNN